jgi:CheY-like chemotaxis protein
MWIDKEFLKKLEESLGFISSNQDVDIKSIFSKYSNNSKYSNLIDIISVQKENINHSMSEAKKQIWIKDGISRLGKDMLSSNSVQEQCNIAITSISRYTDSGSAAIFLYDKIDKVLKLKSSFAYTQREKLSNKFEIGDGIVGQVALEKLPIILTNITKEDKQVTTATVQSTPMTVYTYPITYQENLVGVLEVASFQEVLNEYKAFLDESSELIGQIIFSTLKTEQIDSLLSEAKAQSEELEENNQQLVSQNEELEEQRKSITEQNQELESQNEELEEQRKSIIEQNQELESQKREIEQAQEQLKQKAYQLENSDKYKSEFLANMSHELRTPLNSINLLSSILVENSDKNLNEKQIKRIETINQAGEDLLRLINDILDLSKIEANMMSLSLSNVDLSTLIHELYDYFKPITEEKKLHFNITIQKEAEKILYTDKEKIRQIIKNFLSNAMKFTRIDGTISLNLYLNNSKKYPIAISVKDTGVGISQSKIDTIFEAFQQADGSTRREYGGTGLGLSISKKLAQLCNANILVKSVVDKGSEFILELPDNIDIENIDQKLVDIVDKKDLSQENIDKTKDSILIIEDDLKFANILKNEVEKNGINAILAPNGKDGLDMAIKYKPNGIILDMNLPIMDGWSVLKNLKDNNTTKHIPVKIISVDEPNINTKIMGAIEYLQKPVTLEQVNKTINNLIAKNKKTVKDLLIVEDNDILRENLKDLLSSTDLNISTTSTAQKAINMVKSKDYDCAIIDIGLPDMDGFKLLEKIKRFHCKLPIVIYTGREFSAEELRTLREYSESIVLKTAQSEKRLIEETTLFLHRIDSNLNIKQKELLRKNDDIIKSLENKKVLIVDDDIRNVFALSSVLEDKNIYTVIASNGKEALEVLDNSIDIVLMDIMMPIMDGYDTIRQIREGVYKDIPIIALTAKSQKEDRQKCLEVGANDYLSKPVDYNQLLQLMKVFI